MSDFASAAMLRVLQAGMRRLGLQSPAQQWLDQATVPLNAKQQLVMRVMNDRGIAALLQLGQGLHDLQHDSLMPMLIHKGQPLRVLQAWLRLERYMHSRHRIEQTILSDRKVQHRHFSVRAGTSPSAAEDLVVLGVLIALLQSAGCQQLDVKLPGGLKLWPWQDSPTQQSELRDVFAREKTHTWRITWDNVNVQPKPEIATATNIESYVALSYSERIVQLSSQTLGEALSVEQAAQKLGYSTRSLQRKLRIEGACYIDIMANRRAQRASQMLSSQESSLAEIGFACGYTDQAHFCRDFKRRVGMSPMIFRENSVFDVSK